MVTPTTEVAAVAVRVTGVPTMVLEPAVGAVSVAVGSVGVVTTTGTGVAVVVTPLASVRRA